MGTIGFLILLYIIYLLYKSRKELLSLFFKKYNHDHLKDTTSRRADKPSNAPKDDILNGSEEYVDFEEIDDKKNV